MDKKILDSVDLSKVLLKEESQVVEMLKVEERNTGQRNSSRIFVVELVVMLVVKKDNTTSIVELKRSHFKRNEILNVYQEEKRNLVRDVL